MSSNESPVKKSNQTTPERNSKKHDKLKEAHQNSTSEFNDNASNVTTTTTTNNLSDLLSSKVDEFFAAEMAKLNSHLSSRYGRKNGGGMFRPRLESDATTEILKQNAYIFREIDRFARKQNRLLDSHLGKVQMPEFNMTDRIRYFDDENRRLCRLLKSKNLRNKEIIKRINYFFSKKIILKLFNFTFQLILDDQEREDDINGCNDDDDDDEEEATDKENEKNEEKNKTKKEHKTRERSFYFKRNLEDSRAEKFYRVNQRMEFKRNMLKLMVDKSTQNEEKSRRLRIMSGYQTRPVLPSAKAPEIEGKRFYLT